MLGGGSILGMQRAYKSNVDQIKKFSPLKTRKKYLGYKHIDSLDAKHLTEEEMARLKLVLKKRKQHDSIVSIIVIVIMLITLAVILLMISGKISF